jgi:hypothetical protein
VQPPLKVQPELLPRSPVSGTVCAGAATASMSVT